VPLLSIKLVVITTTLTLSTLGCKADTHFAGSQSPGQDLHPPQSEEIEQVPPVEPQHIDARPPETPPPTIPHNDNPTVVTQGSFRAWAEPPNPRLGQNYNIVIEVTLPTNTTSYQQSDLTGGLTGTDGYRQSIGPNASNFHTDGRVVPVNQSFEFNGGPTARLRIPVPGAATPATVDTVDIRSNLLSEQQRLKIVFGSSPGGGLGSIFDVLINQ